MQNNTIPEQSFLQRNLKKRWVRAFLLLFILSAAFLIALPHLVRHQLEQWLVDNGAQSAEIQKVRLNLFTGTAGIDGLQVQLNDNLVLGDSSFSIDIQLLSLFKKEVHLKTGKLTGLIVDIELSADGILRIGSITLPPSSPETEKTVEEKDIRWLFRADHIELEDCITRISMPKMQKEIVVERALLTNLFTGMSDEHGTLQLKGKVNETQLHLDLKKVRLQPDILAEGLIKVDGYNLDDLQQLLSDVIDPFAGDVTLEGKVQVTRTDQGELVAKYDGDITADKVNLGNNGFSTQGPSISYNGNIQYHQNSDNGILVDVDGLLQGEGISVNVPVADLDLNEKHLQIDGTTNVSIQNGVAVVSDAALDLDSFTLELPPMNVKHSGLKWQGHSEYKLTSDSGIQTVRANGEITLQKPLYRSESNDFSMHTEAGQVSWKGEVEYSIGAEKSNLLLNGTLTGNELNLQIPELLELRKDSLSIAGKTTLNIKPDLQVAYDGDLNLGPVELTASNMKASGNEFTWQGQVGYQLAPQTVSLNGKLLAKELESLLEGNNIQIDQENIAVTFDTVNLQIGEQMLFKGSAELQAEKLQVARDKSPILSLDTTTVSSLAETKNEGVHVEEIILKNLDVPATDAQPVAISVPEIALHSVLTTDFSSVVAESVEISQPTVRDTKNKTMLASLESITGSNIKVDKQRDISLASLSSGNGLFLQKDGDKEQPQVTLAKLLANDISWSAAKGFYCDQIELDSLFANYTKNKPADTAVKETEPDPAPEKIEPEQEEKKKGKSEIIPLQINTITVTGKSGFKFVDQSPSIPFTTSLNLETFKVQDINSFKPDIPFTFLAEGAFDKYSPFDFSGSCTPFSEKFSKESKIRLRNYPLQRISPYTIDSIGTLFTQGQMDVISELQISGNELDLDNDFILKQVETQAVHKDLQDDFNSKLPVSLDTALSMLEDKNGNITLNVPISGPRSDLRVNITDILITAFSKAIMMGVTPYLAYTALGPGGALAYLGLKMGKSLINVGLPDLEFANGASELTDAQKGQLEVVGKNIAANKNQDYSICPRVLVWEFAGDVEKNNANQQKILKDMSAREKLFVLADTRAKNVKEYLVQNFSIDKDRLLICAPTLNFEPGGKPIVTFMK